MLYARCVRSPTKENPISNPDIAKINRDVVDLRDRVRVPPSSPSYTLRRVWLSDEEEDGYYYGFANEGLWPLCHIVFVRPTFLTK